MSDFIDSFNKNTKRLDLTKTYKLAIAVSGGSDSTALCFLCKQAGLNFTAIIVDHKYRKGSTKEANEVKKYLGNRLQITGARVIILTNNKPIPKTGVEEFLRDVRYELIFNYCKKNRIKKLLTAHHLDDQVETFLMRLERGAGLDGLTGIKESSEFRVQNSDYKVKIIRPLLRYTKEELKDYLRKNKIKWWEDPTNENIELTRNNIRKTLSGFSDHDVLRKRISTVIGNIDRARDFIETEKNRAFNQLVKNKNKNISLNLNEYKKLHIEIRLRILRDIVKKYSKTKKDVRISSIKNLDSSLLQKEFKAASLHGINISKKDKNLVIFR